MKKKLTDSQVVELRRLSKTKTYKELSALYRIPLGSISHIVNGRNYGYIQEGIPEKQTLGEIMKNKYGADFYRTVGAEGGKKGRTGGFFANRELAREAGRKGGVKSRRSKKAVDELT